MSGDEGEVNEVRALQLLADRGGDNVTSRPLASLLRLLQPFARATALVRLQRPRARRSSATASWYIVDPLFNEWLRRASPLADRPVLEASDDS